MVALDGALENIPSSCESKFLSLNDHCFYNERYSILFVQNLELEFLFI